MAGMGGPVVGGGFLSRPFEELTMTIKQHLLAAIAVSALAFSPAAYASGEHGGHDMPGMDHAAMEAKLADTSAFGEKGDPAKASRVVKISAKEMRYDPETLTVKAGETITFELVNDGRKSHELTVGDAAYQEAANAMMVMMANMGMDPNAPEHAAMHAKAGNTIVVRSGETGSVTWKFTKPGEFIYACNFIGHAEAGMTGKITVQ
jgi:uncharacterized cupredoxin-like copper-binding protein